MRVTALITMIVIAALRRLAISRTNHYFFDLNRDWFYQTQPETQGRVPYNAWRPQILVDGHEMGAQDTFMTGPPREPINTNVIRILLNGGMFLLMSKQKYLIRIIGVFTVNGMKIYTLVIHSMFNLERSRHPV